MNLAPDRGLLPDPVAAATAQATLDLASLQRQVGQTRKILARLNQHVRHLTESGGPGDAPRATGVPEVCDQTAAQAQRRSDTLPETSGNHEGAAGARAEEARAQAGVDALARAAQEEQNAQLKEATGHLILAALNAQKLQDAAEQARQRQTEFMAVLAHELRNPLAPIRTAAELLGRLEEGDPLLKRARIIIERQVEHMTRLVSDLFDISHASTGRLSLERHRVDFAVVVDEAVRACKPAMDERLQQFIVRLPADPPQMDGDRVRLVQILSNLLDNASKYTAAGGEIRLTVTLLDAALLIIVADNGIGIAAPALPRIFQPFVRDPRAAGTGAAGLGIGLALVRELVEAHGGHVVARSAGTGAGSQFEVVLPLTGRPAPTGFGGLAGIGSADAAGTGGAPHRRGLAEAALSRMR